MVRGTFSPARAWRPAVVARLARTLGVSVHPNTFIEQLWQGDEVDTVFVAMSFQSKYDARFEEIFRPAIEGIRVNGATLRADRVDESKTGDSIITDIVRGISQSRIVLADISALETSVNLDVYRSGNVMYELGIAHAVKSPAKVIVVRDDKEKLLFDVSSIPHNTIDFSCVDAAKKAVAELIADRIEESDKIIDIKLRTFVSTMTPDELHLLERLAACPPGKIMDLTVEVSGIRLTPVPTNSGLVGLRSACIAQAHHIHESPVPLYSLTERGRRLCRMLGIKIA